MAPALARAPMALDTYRMMRKLGLPKEAVMLKMRAELRTGR